MTLITANAKAIAAFLAHAIVTPLAFIGITPETPIETALTLALTALLNAAVVWFSPKNRQ